jgi:hypothetical protein
MGAKNADVKPEYACRGLLDDFWLRRGRLACTMGRRTAFLRAFAYIMQAGEQRSIPISEKLGPVDSASTRDIDIVTGKSYFCSGFRNNMKFL